MTFPNRKPNRLPDYDYAQNGAYFITICAKDQASLFWKFRVGADLIRPDIILSAIGLNVQEAVLRIPIVYPDVLLDRFCIMPDHLHLIILIQSSDVGGRIRSAPTISTIVGQTKRLASKMAGKPIWQKGFYDHVIRDEQDYLTKAQYIDNNPAAWLEKHTP